MARTGNNQILAYIAAPSLNVFLDKSAKRKHFFSKLLWNRVPSIHDRYLPLTKIGALDGWVLEFASFRKMQIDSTLLIRLEVQYIASDIADNTDNPPLDETEPTLPP